MPAKTSTPPLTLDERIQSLMDEQGWSAAKLARVAKVSSAAVYQWLGKGGNVKSLGIESALRLQSASGLSALWLSKGQGPRLAAAQPRAGIDQASLDEVLARLAVLLAPMTESDRHAAAAVMARFVTQTDSQKQLDCVATMRKLVPSTN